MDSALCLNHVSVATGHIRFKGNVVIAGDIEPGMIVRATGSITVGGFIESANVQAQGDIDVGKGIIGHMVTDDEERSCVVKSGGSIRANYAQYVELQAADSIHLGVHSIGNIIRCGNDLTVLDSKMTQGTLSAGNAKVVGKCSALISVWRATRRLMLRLLRVTKVIKRESTNTKNSISKLKTRQWR